ncbi:AraC family transcriptional regulator [Streptomyces sp. ME19-01-6]|uniref:AraC family transcriptional regulator n=1 Tax=Streptomyces sp. ME19-01-6 TaxID=3028686 RepID=UPI0029A00DD5|nr:AraC family transcriptional regulator [Streptomyces sp. ME19-01-6]MDX3228117.1 AraC family transcriptional regulator [Streptomyces sp. ME19-01-6]
MDVLSEAITAMRTGRPHAGRTEKSGPWGVRFPDSEGAGFHVVLQGACWMLPGDGEPVALGPGDVVFMPHGRGYGLADSPRTPLAEFRGSFPDPFARDAGGPDADGAAVADAAPRPDTLLLCGAYFLDRARPHPLLGDLPQALHMPARLGRHPELRSAVELLGGELERRRPGASAVLTSLLDTLLLYVLRAWYEEQSDRTSTGWAAALHDQAVSGALRAIHRDPARPWTVETLGRAAGLSRAAFARRFTELAGQPPLAYLTWWRMTLAARLLRESELPLRAVAERAGYTSEFAFAKAFKREYGVAPGGYRRRGQESAGAPAATSLAQR